MTKNDPTMPSPPTIRNEFKFHTLNEQGSRACNTLRMCFSNTLSDVERVLPAGRERSLVVTKLQEACRWAVAGAAALPENQLSLAAAEAKAP